MNIDERLDKLAARHEALTHTVELLAHQMTDLHRDIEKMERAMEKSQKFINEVAEGTARLLHIAQIHEQRITRLEGDAD